MKKIYISLFLLFGILQLNAQEAKIEKSQELFNGFAYHETINKLENVDNKNIEVNRKLAESHFRIGEYEMAEKYFAEVVANENKTAEDVYNYAEVLKINQKYKQANQQMKAFAKIKPDDSRAQLFLQNKDYHKNLLNDIGQIKLHLLDMNSRQQDFGVAYCGDKLVFTSSKAKKNKIILRQWNWNKLPFLDLYTAELNDNKQLTNIEMFNASFNRKYHEGPASFNKEGTFMAFTRNNYEGESSDHRIKLKIFFAFNEIGHWSIGEPFQYNSDDYSIGHPALTADGNTMYFASDMPGGFGGVDIYVSQKSESGSWSQPVNLGEDINTEGNEMFPFIHQNGLLFYASNGLPGLGGLDIFVATLFDVSKPGKPKNIGTPANSSHDDFAFVVNTRQTEGFLSSSRKEGKGNDDIYRFDLMKPFTPDKLIEGIAKTDKGVLLENVMVRITNAKGEVIDSVQTSDSGEFEFIVPENGRYTVAGRKDQYTEVEKQIEVIQPITNADLVLKEQKAASLYCLVTDKVSKEEIENVEITLKNKQTGEKQTLNTDENGDVEKILTEKKINDLINYDITFKKEGYLTKSITYKQKINDYIRYNLHEELDIALIDMDIEVGEKLNQLLNLQPIYFDLDKAEIRPDAAVELDKIVRFMNENPTVHIQLAAHTDSRASRGYNNRLSHKRAKATMDYIKKRIDNPRRIKGRGYGETKLTNQCKDGVDCTEKQHQMNRRTEFEVVKM